MVLDVYIIRPRNDFRGLAASKTVFEILKLEPELEPATFQQRPSFELNLRSPATES